jgi:hypothetical protein
MDGGTPPTRRKPTPRPLVSKGLAVTGVLGNEGAVTKDTGEPGPESESAMSVAEELGL